MKERLFLLEKACYQENVKIALDIDTPAAKGTEIGEVINDLILPVLEIAHMVSIGSFPKRLIQEDLMQRILMVQTPVYFAQKSAEYSGEDKITKGALARLAKGPNIDFKTIEKQGFSFKDVKQEIIGDLNKRFGEFREEEESVLIWSGGEYEVKLKETEIADLKRTKLEIEFIDESASSLLRIFINSIKFTDWEEYDKERRSGKRCSIKQWVISADYLQKASGEVLLKVDEADRDLLLNKPDKIG